MNTESIQSNGVKQGLKVHIETWGCQMNVADSERMLSLLQKNQYQLTQEAEDADLILLNTCHIREKARHKVLSRLGVLDRLKLNNPSLKIAVAGCVAQADGKKLLDLAPQIDVLLGPGKIEELPELLIENARTGVSVHSLGFARENKEDLLHAKHEHKDALVELPSITGRKEVTRFVNIIQGCNNFCTFCVVPFTRGREISRPTEEVLSEVEQLVANGAREITLLGQNVNSYGLDLLNTDIVPDDGGPFLELLKKVSKIKDVERIRFTTSNPHDFTKPLAEFFGSEPKMGKHMHLPVQAGSNNILERMKRKVTVEQYLEKIEWLRSAVPDIAISTDIIVGFPGETQSEFEETLALLEKVRFSFVYAFKYSARKGTAAARFQDHIPETVLDERLASLNLIQNKITEKFNQDEIGQIREVFFIYESRKEPGIFIGRTPHFRTVRVRSSKKLVGKTEMVQITAATKVAMEGNVWSVP